MRKRTLVPVVAVVLAAVAVVSWSLAGRPAPTARPDVATFARQQLWNALQPVTLASCDLQRLGESQDGGYLACANLLGGVKAYFHVANLHVNNYACTGRQAPFGAWAYEVLFVNKRLTAATPEPRATPYHPLDRPNAPAMPDCQTPVL